MLADNNTAYAYEAEHPLHFELEQCPPIDSFGDHGLSLRLALSRS